MTSEYVLRTHYNLTPKMAAQLLVAQGGRCACGKAFTKGRPWVVDHDHLTGLVRGFMDHTCNHEVGFHHDNAAWFQAIATYLDDPPAPRVIGRIYVPGSAGEAGALDEQHG